ALMLTIVLLGIALGGALAPLLARASFAWVAAGSSLAVVTGYLVAGPLHIPGPPELVHYAIPLMLPAAVLSGFLFTLLGAELRAGSENPNRRSAGLRPPIRSARRQGLRWRVWFSCPGWASRGACSSWLQATRCCPYC